MTGTWALTDGHASVTSRTTRSQFGSSSAIHAGAGATPPIRTPASADETRERRGPRWCVPRGGGGGGVWGGALVVASPFRSVPRP